MESLLTILAAAGLAGAAGHRAFIPAFLLGVGHHASALLDSGATFALGERFVWLANPVVLAILGGLIVVEFLAEANPDIPELAEWALKAPKLLAGFVVVGAIVGTVSDNLTLMLGSGILGAGTAGLVDSVRATIKRGIDEGLGAATDGASTKGMALIESGWAAGISVASVVMPVLILFAVAVILLAWKGHSLFAREAKVPCPSCGATRHPDATACPHCKASIGASAERSLAGTTARAGDS